MPQSFRHPEILDLARSQGKVTVEDLARHFGVTLQTIRRDLAELAETGQLTRVHGGAMLPSGVVNIEYEARRSMGADGKAAIARAVAADISDGIALCLNIGTTTEAVARALGGRRNLMVVTNNINVATTLVAQDGVRVTLTGGRLRAADGGLVGVRAAAAIGEFRFDLAVIGCSALSAGGEMLDFDPDEVAVSRAIIARAQAVWLVADQTKLARTAPARIATLEALDRVYTDAPLPDGLAALCAGWGTEVKVASAGQPE